VRLVYVDGALMLYVDLEEADTRDLAPATYYHISEIRVGSFVDTPATGHIKLAGSLRDS